MSIILSMETVNPVLDELLKEFGEDYVYPALRNGYRDCAYAKDNQPSCLVGHVLHRLGVPVEDLNFLDNQRDSQLSTLAGSDKYWDEYEDAPVLALALIGVAWEDDAISLLSVAQTYQDVGETWGTAVAQARAVR